MTLDEFFEEEDYDKWSKEEEQEILKGKIIAKSKGINFKKFKEILTPHLKFKDSEDMWVWNYETFLCWLSIREGELLEWAKFHYQNDYQD